MAIREGRWDCPSCGSTGQLGRHTSCQSCANPRPQGIRFYLPGDEPTVTDGERLAEARAGADWVCQHCGGSARAGQEHCPGCGAPRGSSPGQAVREYGVDDVPRAGKAPPRAAPQAPAARKGRRGWVAGLLALVFAGWCGTRGPDGFLSGALDGSREVEAVVQDKYWTRTVQVERLGPVEETGTALPEGARLIQSWREVVRHEDVLDHYETRTRQVSERVQVGTREYVCGQRDMGNGYFEDITCTEPEYDTEYRTETYEEPVYRREPVYGTMYRYRVDRWSPDTLLKAGGARDEPPAWPAVRLREKQREGARTEEYVVLARDTAGTLHTVRVPLPAYRAQRVGAPVLLRVTRGGEATLVPATPEAADTTVSAAAPRPENVRKQAARLPGAGSAVTFRTAFPTG